MMPETNFVQPNEMEAQDIFIHEVPNKKKRKSPNGFIKYRTTQWQSFKKKNPNVTTQQFSSIAAKEWNSMPDSQKNYYIKLNLEKSSKKNKGGPKRKYNKRNKKNDTTNQDLPVEYLQLDFNNYYEENLENFQFTNQADEYLLPPYLICPVYYDATLFYDFYYYP